MLTLCNIGMYQHGETLLSPLTFSWFLFLLSVFAGVSLYQYTHTPILVRISFGMQGLVDLPKLCSATCVSPHIDQMQFTGGGRSSSTTLTPWKTLHFASPTRGSPTVPRPLQWGLLRHQGADGPNPEAFRTIQHWGDPRTSGSPWNVERNVIVFSYLSYTVDVDLVGWNPNGCSRKIMDIFIQSPTKWQVGHRKTADELCGGVALRRNFINYMKASNKDEDNIYIYTI